MNIPDNVEVGYKTYQVKQVNDFLIKEDAVCYGLIQNDEALIQVSTMYDIDQQKCTFIHELLHAIDNVCESDLSENQIRILGKGLYDVIKNNKNIFQ